MPIPVFARTSQRRPRDSVRALNTGRGRQSQFRGQRPVFYAATLSRIPSNLSYPQIALGGEVIQRVWASTLLHMEPWNIPRVRFEEGPLARASCTEAGAYSTWAPRTVARSSTHANLPSSVCR